MRALIPCACSLLLGTGCLTPLIAQERAAKVQRISRFDSGCDSMRLVRRMGHQRYMLRGCQQTYIYACHDRTSWHRDPEVEAIDMLLTGGMDADAPCQLVSVRRLAPNPGRRQVAHAMRVTRPEATGAISPDEPGIEGLGAPASASAPTSASAPPALPQLPEPAEVKRTMTGVEPGLRRCALPPVARLQVRLKLAASGRVQRATVQGTDLAGPARRCVERQLVRARVSPFQAGPVTLAYLFDLR